MLHFLFSYPWGNTYHDFPYLLNADGKQAIFFLTLSVSECMEKFLLKFGLSLDWATERNCGVWESQVYLKGQVFII